MKLMTMRCHHCGLFYQFRMVNAQRLVWVLEHLRCTHCGRARMRQGDLPGRRCSACNMPDWLLPSFKGRRAEMKLVVGLCAADYVAMRRRMNKERSQEQDMGNEGQ